MGRWDDGKGGLAHREGNPRKPLVSPSWHRTICDARVLGSATHREASWSRSNFFWGTFRCKRPNATLAANSEFDQPSMIALASSRILELGERLWKGCRPSTQETIKAICRECNRDISA